MFGEKKFKHYKICIALFVLTLLYLSASTFLRRDLLIGARTIEYRDEVRNRPVVVELWYPTEEKEPLSSPIDPLWIHPQEVRNGEISKKQKRYPLLLMSHGHKGDRKERSWLANLLAKEGYIIAAVDHYGDTRSTFNPLISLSFWERPLDLSFALDQLLKEPAIQDRIDIDKIGFIGYSLGGMTGLGLAGAQAKNVRQILKEIIESNQEIPADLLSQIDFEKSEKNYLEPRIKAMLLICPASFVYSAENLKKIKIPIGLIAAIDDEVLPHKNHSHRIIKYAIPSKSIV